MRIDWSCAILYKAWCAAVISGFSTALIGAFSILAVHSVICSLSGPLSHGSPIVVFFDGGHPRFWNFYSTISVDVVRVVFDPISFQSGLYPVLWACSKKAEVSVRASRMFWSCSLILPVWSSSLSDVHLAAFTGNPANYAILFSRVDNVSDLKTARTPRCCRQRRSSSDRPLT